MAKQTLLETTKQRMQELRESRAAQLAAISQKQEEAHAQIKQAADDMRSATEEMNVDKYEEAKHRKQRAQIALDMYTGRKAQLEKQEIITEAESDAVIDGLLDYEKELEVDFKAALAGYLRQLKPLYNAYKDEIAAVERTLSEWQGDIHANYRSRGGAFRTDPETGRMTDRMDKPYAVHMLPYSGCNEAIRLEHYLEKEAALINAEN
jgi:hypothetical protein